MQKERAKRGIGKRTQVQLTHAELDILRAYCGSPLRKLRVRRPDLAARIELNEVINEVWVRVVEALNARKEPPDNRGAWLAETIRSEVRSTFTMLLDQYWSRKENGTRVLKVRHISFTELVSELQEAQAA